MQHRLSEKAPKRNPVLCTLVVAGSALLMPPGGLRSDPLVIVRAMTATTVAEIYVEPDSVTVELEIGLADLDAFRHLIPVLIYARLGLEPRALR